MSRRTIILIGMLALSFVGLLVFLAMQFGMEPWQLAFAISFGVLLVAIAVASARQARKAQRSTSSSSPADRV